MLWPVDIYEAAAVSGATTCGGMLYPEHARLLAMDGSGRAVSDSGIFAGPGTSIRDISE